MNKLYKVSEAILKRYPQGVDSCFAGAGIAAPRTPANLSAALASGTINRRALYRNTLGSFDDATGTAADSAKKENRFLTILDGLVETAGKAANIYTAAKNAPAQQLPAPVADSTAPVIAPQKWLFVMIGALVIVGIVSILYFTKRR
jgi:hypothetical protein